MSQRMLLGVAAWLCAAPALSAQTREQGVAMVERRIGLNRTMPAWLVKFVADLPDELPHHPMRRQAYVELTPSQRVEVLVAMLARGEEVDDWWWELVDPRRLTDVDRASLVLGAMRRARELLAKQDTHEAAFALMSQAIGWVDRTTLGAFAAVLLPYLTLVETDGSAEASVRRRDADSAWGLAREALAIAREGALIEHVVATAARVLNADAPLGQSRLLTESRDQPGPGWCMVIGEETTAALALRAADFVIDARLHASLLARTMAKRPSDDERCLVDSWVQLAPKLDAEAMRRLHSVLQSRFESPQSPWVHVGYALFAGVPADLLPWYHRWLASAADRTACARLLGELGIAVPRDRVQFLFDGAGSEPPLPIRASFDGVLPLFRRSHQLLAREWHAGGRRRGDLRDYASLDLIEAGVPSEVVARELRFTYTVEPTPLARLALVAPHGCRGLDIAVERASVGAPDADLDALRRLFDCPDPGIARAVTMRALRLGRDGRAFVDEALASAATRESQVAAIVGALLQFGVVVPGLPQALTRLTSPQHRSLVTDGELLLRAARTFGACLPWLALSGRELDPVQLRAVLTTSSEPDAVLLQWLGPFGDRGTPSLFASALTLAADLPAEVLPVAAATSAISSSHAAVRAAAYRILQRLDRARHREGWLADEAEFDPDPRVRQVAGR